MAEMADDAQDGFHEPEAGSKEARERFGAELKRFGLGADSSKLEVVSPYEPAGDQPQIGRAHV